MHAKGAGLKKNKNQGVETVAEKMGLLGPLKLRKG